MGTRLKIIPSGDETWIKIHQRSYRSPLAQAGYMAVALAGFLVAGAVGVLGIYAMEGLTVFYALMLMFWAVFMVLLFSAILTQFVYSEILIVSSQAILRRSGTALWRKTERFIRADMDGLRWIAPVKGNSGIGTQIATASQPSHLAFTYRGKTHKIAYAVSDAEGAQIIEMLETASKP